MELTRSATLADQLASELRAAILRGDYLPGAPLPSEAALIKAHGVSRITVRGAIAALRAQGLITVAHGKGSYVRTLASTEQLHRRAPGHVPGEERPDEPVPVIAYAPAGPDIAAVLRIEVGAEVIVREIRETTPPAPHITTSYLPAALAAGTPLAEPGTTISGLDDALTSLGRDLTFTERVTARMPTPEEASTFSLPAGVPMLHTTRLTTDATDGTPIEARVTVLPAAGIELEYDLPSP